MRLQQRRRFLGVAIALNFLIASRLWAQAALNGEIVVAIRYLKPTGVSHSHLYLYREDGRFLRQLTDDNTGQDSKPVFAPDGETIVWTRTRETNGKATTEYWSIRPRGGDLKRLTTAPAWYQPGVRESPYFTDHVQETATPAAPVADTTPESTVPRYRAPDGSVEMELRVDKSDPDADVNQPGHGKTYILRDLKTGQEVLMGKLPGFLGLTDLLHENTGEGRRFLFDGPLKVAFFSLHLDSTEGTTVFVLDLPTRRLVRLSPNWAAPFPLPGQAAFLTLTENRYVPFSPDGKTANSSYVERWDADLHKIRYAHTGAALCYGASLYRPGQTPATVIIN